MTAPTITQGYVYPFDAFMAEGVMSAKSMNVSTSLNWLVSAENHQRHVPYSGVSYLMLEARQLIELLPHADQEPYRLCRIYGHLCAHARPLDNDLILYQQLEEIADASALAMQNGGEDVYKLFYNIIYNSLAPLKLRSQLKELFAKFGMQSEFWDDDTLWIEFVKNLSYLIAYKRMMIPAGIVLDELEMMGGFVDSTPALDLTAADETNEKVRRARKYFRRMATVVGFPRGVPISLQLVPRFFILNSSPPSTHELLKQSLPEEVCWAVGLPGGHAYAPFAMPGVPPQG